MRRRRPGDPSGRVEVTLQPGVIRHATVYAGKPDLRAVQISLDHGELRVAVTVPDVLTLMRELEDATRWVAEG